MMNGLKRFLKDLIKNNANILRYIAYGAVLISAVIIVRCETQRKIKAEIRYQEAEEKIENLEDSIRVKDVMYDSIMNQIEKLKIEVDGVKIENNVLRDSLQFIRPAIDRMSGSELKKLWSDYKSRYHLRNDR